MTSQILEHPFIRSELIAGPDAKVLFFYRQLARAQPAQAEQQLLRALRCELDLPGLAQRRRTLDRLRAWLALPPQDARQVAAVYRKVRAALLPLELEDLQAIEHEAGRNGLSGKELTRLRALLPSELIPMSAGGRRQPQSEHC